MFKKGDRIVRTGGDGGFGMVHGNTYTVSKCDADNVIVDEIPNEAWSPEYFVLAESQFDVKKDPWYVIVSNREEAKLVQSWLFEQGLQWQSGGATHSHLGERVLTNDSGCDRIFHASFGVIEKKKARGSKELKFSFKRELVIDKVTLPDVESPQQKQIKELEETIRKASEQIEQLKKGM
ncbi:hypothetical protein vBPpSSYP_43 [Pseudomonas phage vB_PpS_SYP]|nr:hypothetical protein vBPpSSYP_43 [Pseudomonas phage vB_PpS_SYP]